MNKRSGWLAAFAAGVVSSAFTSVSAQVPGETLAIYSNICFSPESGDIGGQRIILFRAGSGPSASADVYVLFQAAEGELQRPLFEKAAVNGDQIRAEIHFPNLGTQTFVGRVTPTSIEGSYLNGNGRRLVLPRQPEAENRFPPC